MSRIAAFTYGAICYLIFLGTFLYAIGFVGNIVVPKSVDSGTPTSLTEALIVNTILLSLFAIQHSVMARRWFKQAWTKIVPPPIERSTYVLLASLVLILLFWQWRPITSIVWDVENSIGRIILWAIFWIGWGTVLFSTYLVDHRALFGLKQVGNYLKGKPSEEIAFQTPGLYKVVRHPLYAGFIVAFWSTPRMTFGHLFFAAVCSAYIIVAIQFEERDLMHYYGDKYREYRTRVGMLLPVKFGSTDKA